MTEKVREVASALLLLAAGLFAQNPTATVVGRVLDISEAVVPSAKLEIRSTDTNEVRKVFSNERGEFTVPNLAPGPYEIVISKEGFASIRDTSITLQMEQVARLEFRLAPGALAETVEVIADAPLINTENGGQGEVMLAGQVLQMPLDGRDFSDLAFLVPGVLPSNASGSMGSDFAVNGARADNTNFILDGFNNREQRLGRPQAHPNIDALQEFKMQTSNYSAEYGRLAGGTMNMVLKSGSNQLHGTLFEFVRNDLFDTRNFFDADKSELRQNQFGGTVSGPVRIPRVYNGRNRTFFLFSWESSRQVQGNSNLAALPSTVQRTGDFTKTGPIADPLSTGSCPGSTGKGACFPGATIPAARLSSQALAAQKFYPQPNLVGQLNNYLSYFSAPNSWDSWVMKFDERISSKDTLSFRYSKRYSTRYAPYTNPVVQGSNNTGLFGSHIQAHDTLTGLTFTRIFTPNVINEARIGFSRSTEHDWGPGQGTNYAAQFGIPGTTDDPRLTGFPLINISGVQQLGPGANLPLLLAANSIDFGDTLTWVKGQHLFKMGASILRGQFNQPFWNNSRGQFNFTGSWTGQSYADFLLGYLNGDSRQIGSVVNYMRDTQYGFFVQDDWKITSRLSLNLGLRYEIPQPPHDKYGQWANFIPGLNKMVVGSDETFAANGITFTNPAMLTTAGELGIPKALVYTNHKDFAPRFGFAWRPFGGNRLVVRGGYGIFYGGLTQNIVRNSLGNVFPFVINQSTNANATNPLFLTLANPFPTPPSLNGNLSTIGLNGYELHPPPPYLQSWNVTIERQIGRSTAVEASYKGSKGTHFPLVVNINQPYREAQYAPNFPFPYPQFSTINYFSFEDNSNNQAGSLTLRRRLARDSFFTLNYTYGKCIDDAAQVSGASPGGFNGLQDPRNLRGDRGRCDWDVRQAVTGSFSWVVPFHNNRLIRGWQVTGTGRLYTGAPFTPRVTNSNLNLGEASRPNRIGEGTVPNPNVSRWYNVADFPVVPRGSFAFGNSGRCILDAPGLIGMNMGLFKNFVVRERTSFQFRWEVFNVLNHANFGMPVNAVNAPNAGTITSAGNGRLMQVSLKLQM